MIDDNRTRRGRNERPDSSRVNLGRRRVLSTVGPAGVLALAGCLTTPDDGNDLPRGDDDDESVREADVSDERDGDPGSETLRDSIETDVSPRSITEVGGYLAVVDREEDPIYVYDPWTGNLEATIDHDGPTRTEGIFWDGISFWLAVKLEGLYRVDSEGGLIDFVDPLGRTVGHYNDVVVSGTSVWFLNRQLVEVLEYTLDDIEPVDDELDPVAEVVREADSFLEIQDVAMEKVHDVVDPSSSSAFERNIDLGDQIPWEQFDKPSGLDFDGGRLWISNGLGYVHEVSPDTGLVEQSISVPGVGFLDSGPSGVTVYDETIYCCEHHSGKIYQIG